MLLLLLEETEGEAGERKSIVGDRSKYPASGNSFTYHTAICSGLVTQHRAREKNRTAAKRMLVLSITDYFLLSSASFTSGSHSVILVNALWQKEQKK